MHYVVGLVKEFMEISVNKISRIPSEWSELENKIKKKTLVSEANRKFRKKTNFLKSSLANVRSHYLLSFLSNDIHFILGWPPVPFSKSATFTLFEQVGRPNSYVAVHRNNSNQCMIGTCCT